MIGQMTTIRKLMIALHAGRIHVTFGWSYRCALMFAGVLAACASPPPAAPPPVPVVAPTVSAPLPVASPPVEPVPLPVATIAAPPAPAVAPKEAPPVDLPEYARRGKRLPADGGPAGRAVIAYCRSFELDKDATSYFKRLQREKRLPSDAEIAERNRQSDQSLTVQQYVERDWALRRDNNRSAPQKCKVLGGSSEGATAHIVFEADLNGRRQRGTAAVTLSNGKWRLRDHGDWLPVISTR
jgi:hypothetical protein